jgi:3-hydroxyacyl-[acyl-carrier-protein] dehydratase
MEVMAQTCGWLVSGMTGFTGLPVLAQVKEGKLRTAVFPGMQLSTEGKIVHEGSGFAIADANCKSDGVKVADARLTFRVIPYPNPEFHKTMVAWAERLHFPLQDFRK